MADIEVLRQLFQLLRVILHSRTFDLLRCETFASRTTRLRLERNLLAFHYRGVELLRQILTRLRGLRFSDLGDVGLEDHLDLVGVGQDVQLAVLGDVPLEQPVVGLLALGFFKVTFTDLVGLLEHVHLLGL